ncbi:high-potential iron-sulfur protein [Marinobacter sp.]|uniref:high-potential iron-sulfur protein n=1 Tax=Marinobacter sp. TaxID=50741 RepID=UPI00356A3F60
MNDHNPSRRVFLRTAALGIAAVPLARFATYSGNAQAQDLPKAEDGHALDYVNDASEADHEKYQSGQKCESCAFWAGEEADGWGKCRHPEFTDVLVNAEGWCNTYAPRG